MLSIVSRDIFRRLALVDKRPTVEIKLNFWAKGEKSDRKEAFFIYFYDFKTL